MSEWFVPRGALGGKGGWCMGQEELSAVGVVRCTRGSQEELSADVSKRSSRLVCTRVVRGPREALGGRDVVW